MALIEIPFLDQQEGDFPDLVDTKKIDFIGHPARVQSGNFYKVILLVSGARVEASFTSIDDAANWYNLVKGQIG